MRRLALFLALVSFAAGACTDDGQSGQAAEPRGLDGGMAGTPAASGGAPPGSAGAPPGAGGSAAGAGPDASAGAPPLVDAAPDARDAAHDSASVPARDAEPVEAGLADVTPGAPDAGEAGPRYDVPLGYPPGPYGRTVGSTLAPLRWEGYVSPDGAALARDQGHGPYSPDDLRRSGRSLALVHFADFDCPGCRSSALSLAARGAELSLAGAAVVEVLVSKQYSDPANRTHLDAWVATYDLTVTTVIDAPGHELESLDAIGIRETAVIVELPSMRILWRATGDLFGVGASSVELAATELVSRLPPP